MTTVEVPELALVLLVGISGSGKSTFAREHFLPSQVLSSDAFRAMVADDENDQSASGEAFDVLHYLAAKRLKAGRLTVVDATNVQSHARAGLVKVTKEHDVLPVAIVIDTPEPICWERTQTSPDRDFNREVLKRQHRDLRRSLGQLQREGFRKVHVLGDTSGVQLRYEPLFNNRKELTGPFDLIGDVHDCELLPWSAKAETFIHGYAAVGAVGLKCRGREYLRIIYGPSPSRWIHASDG
jgi:predicted kinase